METLGKIVKVDVIDSTRPHIGYTARFRSLS